MLIYLAKSDAFDINALPIKVGRLRFSFSPPLWTPRMKRNGSWVQRLSVTNGTVTVRDASRGYKLRAALELVHPPSNWYRNITRSYSDLSRLPDSPLGPFNASAPNTNPNGFGAYCLERFLEPDTVVSAAKLSDIVALKNGVVWYHRNVDTAEAHDVPTFYENVMRTQGLDPQAFADPLLGRTFGAHMAGPGFSRINGSNDVLAASSESGHEPLVLETTLHTVESCPDEAEFLKALSAAVTTEGSRGSLLSKTTAHNEVWEELWGRSHVDISVSDLAASRASADSSEKKRMDPSNVEAVNKAYVYQRYLDLCDGRNSYGIIKFNGQAFTTSLNGTQQGHKPGVVSADYRDWGQGNWIQNSRQPYYAAVAAGDSDIIIGMLRYFNRSLPVARARVNATMGIGGAFWPETSTLFGTYDAAFLGYGCNGTSSDGSLVAAEPAPYTVARDSRHGAPPTAPAVNGYTRFYTSGSLEICLIGLEDYSRSMNEETLRQLTLPICDAVTQFYRERFNYTNSTTGYLDLFPGQVLESFWCGNGGAGTNAWGHVDETGQSTRAYSRSECPTNGAPDVAGLRAVLPKLLALPTGVLGDQYADSKAAWAASLKVLPPLALEDCYWGQQDPPDASLSLRHQQTHGARVNMGCRKCAPHHNSTSCWCNGHMPCYPPTNKSMIVAIAQDYAGLREHNHENHACYAIWPFRQFAIGKPDIVTGVATYTHRPHPCTHNWCQDVADAAVLGLASDAASQIIERATAPPLASRDGTARFLGFSQHYEDYAPAADHLSMMRIAVNEMLLGQLDDDVQTITLFPGWPAGWNVDFKLRGPQNTTVEAACMDGQLTKLVVTPKSRKGHVQVHNCKAAGSQLKSDDTLSLVRTIQNCSGSKHCDGLSYVVQARSYPTSPRDLVATMRGGGVAVWRWGPEPVDLVSTAESTPALNVRSFVLPGVPTEGQDSLGNMLVVVELNRGVVVFDWPSMQVRGRTNISVSGALHCKIWHHHQTNRTFVLVTTGLTHVEADRDYLVAVEVTDRDAPREVARVNTPVRATEGVLVLGEYAYVGGYVPNNRFVSVSLEGLVNATRAMLRVSCIAGPRPEYDNMVGALENSSFRADDDVVRPPLMFFGSYARPGGLLVFESHADGTLREPVGTLLTQATARTNRVHISPNNKFALLALEKGFVGTDTPPIGETGGLAIVDIRDATAPRLIARAASPDRGGRVYTGSWSPSGRFLVSFSAQNRSAFIYSFADRVK